MGSQARAAKPIKQGNFPLAVRHLRKPTHYDWVFNVPIHPWWQRPVTRPSTIPATRPYVTSRSFLRNRVQLMNR